MQLLARCLDFASLSDYGVAGPGSPESVVRASSLVVGSGVSQFVDRDVK